MHFPPLSGTVVCWDKPHLVILRLFCQVLLDLICEDFVEDFCVNVLESCCFLVPSFLLVLILLLLEDARL
jgi:hypothetical protein